MKHRVMWIVWALAPIAAIGVHMGPGQRLLARDRAGAHLRVALAAQQREDWAEAAKEFAAARDTLPAAERAERTRLAISEAKARIQAGELVEAQTQLEAILTAEEAAPDKDAAVVRTVRDELATAGYFAAWLMRLEGAAPEEWKPEAERSRQLFRLLAEDAQATSDPESEAFKKNVEAVIRLEQMDLSELQALPLPKNCPSCCKNLCQKKRDQRLSKCKNKGEKDAREEIKQYSAGAATATGKGH